MNHNDYPLPLPNPYNPSPAIKVCDEGEYDLAVQILRISCVNDHSVANPPKRNKDTKRIEDDAFPFFVQIGWMPWCDYYIRCWNKDVKHRNFVDIDEAKNIQGVL